MKNLHQIAPAIQLDNVSKSNLWYLQKREKTFIIRITTEEVPEGYTPIQYCDKSGKYGWDTWYKETWRWKDWVAAGSPEPNLSGIEIGPFPFERN